MLVITYIRTKALKLH